jgi:hypothetical protein
MIFASNMSIIISLVAGVIFVTVTLLLLPQPIPQLVKLQQVEQVQQVSLDDPVIAYPCEYTIIQTNSSGTFYTCRHPTERANIVFQLPTPAYKQVLCTSTYSCSHSYSYQEIIPSDLLTSEQKRAVIDKVLNLPELKVISGWQIVSFNIQPIQDKWTANVDFHSKVVQPSSGAECWQGDATIDLETLDVIGVEVIPPRADVNC